MEVEPERRIVLKWDADEGTTEDEGAKSQTTVTITFEPLDDGRTLVSIEEQGWRDSEGGFKAAFGNCQGWSQMLCALKVWLEHGINLREGMYT